MNNSGIMENDTTEYTGHMQLIGEDFHETPGYRCRLNALDEATGYVAVLGVEKCS